MKLSKLIMETNLILSKKYIINDYFTFIRMFFLLNRKTISSIKTSIKLKLVKRKFLLKLYKKLLRFTTLSNILHSYILLSYFIIKKWIFTYLPTTLTGFFNSGSLLFFSYHFLLLYRAIFLIKMILDWFPIKNWDRSSPIKRFLRRVTINWAKQFEKYFPSIFAWLIVINIIPIILSLLETSFVIRDLKNFPTSYNFEELIAFVNESSLLTLK